jgi:hypothetical protein
MSSMVSKLISVQLGLCSDNDGVISNVAASFLSSGHLTCVSKMPWRWRLNDTTVEFHSENRTFLLTYTICPRAQSIKTASGQKCFIRTLYSRVPRSWMGASQAGHDGSD